MSSLLLDLLCPSQRHDFRVGILRYLFSGNLGNVSHGSLSFRNSRFDIKPELKLVLFIEDTPHFRTAISARIDWKDRQSKSTRLRRGMILNNSEQQPATVVRYSRNHRTRGQEGVFQARSHFECHEEPRHSHSIDKGRRKIWISRIRFMLTSVRTFPESKRRED